MLKISYQIKVILCIDIDCYYQMMEIKQEMKKIIRIDTASAITTKNILYSSNKKGQPMRQH
jgi:hypothetical protein